MVNLKTHEKADDFHTTHDNNHGCLGFVDCFTAYSYIVLKMTVRNDIDEYIAFFRDKTAEIGQLEVLPIYRKILYLVEIDTLSRAAFPNENGHKKRVMKFLDEYSNWRGKTGSVQSS